MQRIQILGGAVGDLFGTQIGASQPAHGRRTDGTFGVGMSATRKQTKDICLLYSFESITRPLPVRRERGRVSQPLTPRVKSVMPHTTTGTYVDSVSDS